MTAIQEKSTQFQTLLAEAEGLAGKSNPTKSERERLEAALLEAEGLKGQIAALGRADGLRAWGGQAGPMLPLAGIGQPTPVGMTPSGTSEGILGEPDEGMPAATRAAISTTAYKAAFREYLRQGHKELAPHVMKTLSEGSDTAGGFLVPEDVLSKIISKEPAPTSVEGRVTQLPTSRDVLAIPKVNYTTDNIYSTGIRVTWTGEVPASATTARVTDPVFGFTRIPVYTAMMSMPLTNDLVEDSVFPVVSWVSEKFSETIRLLRENMILNGSGIGQPYGIMTNPGTTDQPATVKTGNASALTADGLVNLGFSLPPQYDNDAVWVFNKTNTAQAMGALKDSNGRYLWGLGVDQSGVAFPIKGRSLLGYDVLYSQLMPNVGAGTYPILFGDLKGYYLVNRVGFSIQVLRELYAETNQILLLGRIRFGGVVAEPWRLYAQVVSA